MLDRLCENTECRIVAVDYEDRVQVGQTTVELLPGGKSRSTDIVFSGIKLDDIKEFQFQTRLLNQEIVRDNHKSSPNAGVAQKTRLIKAAGEGDLFESNYFN